MARGIFKIIKAINEAGVTILLTSHGLDDTGTFLKAVRKAVQRGLSADSALRALTTTPASLYKATELVGTLETGKLANFLVADGDLFAADTKVLETWVNGNRFQFSPPPLIDARGSWNLTYNTGDKQNNWTLIVDGAPGKLTGTLTVTPTKNGKPVETKCSRISLRDARLCKIRGRHGLEFARADRYLHQGGVPCGGDSAQPPPARARAKCGAERASSLETMTRVLALRHWRRMHPP